MVENYGKEISNNHGMERAALHAVHLEFFQPITGEALAFEAKLPEDICNALNG